jgi:hypothetical protein
VKRLLAGLAGVLGIRWLLRKRREAVARDAAAERAAADQAPEAVDPRADELRERIEQAKATADDRDDFEAGETPVDAPDPAARRAAVHEEARTRIAEMAERPADETAAEPGAAAPAEAEPSAAEPAAPEPAEPSADEPTADERTDAEQPAGSGPASA